MKDKAYFNFCPSCYWTSTTFSIIFKKCPRCNDSVYIKKISLKGREVTIEC